MSASHGNWIACTDSLPEIGDYSVLAFWAANGGMDMVHVEQYFAQIRNGFDHTGGVKYTFWYVNSGITHWMPMPNPPEES